MSWRDFLQKLILDALKSLATRRVFFHSLITAAAWGAAGPLVEYVSDPAHFDVHAAERLALIGALSGVVNHIRRSPVLPPQ